MPARRRRREDDDSKPIGKKKKEVTYDTYDEALDGEFDSTYDLAEMKSSVGC
jgi:hypothetical protein